MAGINTPIKIGSCTLKNRVTFAPTVKFDFTDDSGVATKKLVDHYAKRAAGGAGLICVEATAVVPGGRFGKIHMGLWNDEQMESHKAITKACHDNGAVVIIQLNHTGYVSNPECGLPIGPSEIRLKNHRGEYTTVSMSIDEIHEMQEAFANAAERAMKAGYDGIQLHGCHGYMINQFISPRNNLRTDEYGGCVENRARFAVEIIKEIRKRCGKDFLISVRTSGYDDSLEDAIGVADEYVKAGCDYLQVSSGMTDLVTLKPFKDERVSDIQSLGVYFKEHFNGVVPVSCVGGIDTPEKAKYLVENDYVDTVDIARAILADPNFSDACVNGSDYIKCYHCKACQYGPFTKHVCPAEMKRTR